MKQFRKSSSATGVRHGSLGRRAKLFSLFRVLLALWLIVIGAGLWTLWGYENRPGRGANAPSVWPAETRIRRAESGPTLVMLAHPHCPCTRASIHELDSLMAHASDKVTAYVIFLKPEGFDTEWARTDLWRSAESIPGVHVVADDGGAEAQRFGAATSGQTLLYSQEGRLLFSGGITASRGHEGDSAGKSALISILAEGSTDQTGTLVFGCPLFDEHSDCRDSKHGHN